MNTVRTSSVKSFYISTRQLVARMLGEPSPAELKDDKSLEQYLKENREEQNQLFYRPISFTAPLNQKIEIPREGLTTLELTGITFNDVTRTPFDFYDLSSQNLGFILSFQIGEKQNHGYVRKGETTHIAVTGFDQEFLFGKGCTMPRLDHDGNNWNIGADNMINKTNRFEAKQDFTVKPEELVYWSGGSEQIETIISNHRKNLIFRINRYLSGFKDYPESRKLHIVGNTKNEIFSEQDLRNIISLLRIAVSDNGCLFLVCLPSEFTFTKENILTNAESEAFISLRTELDNIQFRTFGRYFNLRMANEKEVSLENQLILKNSRTSLLIGRCRINSFASTQTIQPQRQYRGILKVLLYSTAANSNQYFWTQNNFSIYQENDWTHTIAILGANMAITGNAKITLAPGRYMDSIELAIVNEFNDPIWTSNNIILNFAIENDIGNQNPIL